MTIGASHRQVASPQRELESLEKSLSRSRWYFLGRVLGRQPEVIDCNESLASVKLSGARKALKQSRWLRLGRRLGFEKDY